MSDSSIDILASLRDSSTTQDESPAEQFSGLVTRICQNKYGFITSDTYENIFFHFSELSQEAKTNIEPGSKVLFYVSINRWASDKNKAVRIEVCGGVGENEFKGLEGVVTCDVNARDFCIIESGTSTYLFHTANLVCDDVSKACGLRVKEGHKVIFDSEWNHKYNPPKPFAVNVRIVPGQDGLNTAAAALETQLEMSCDSSSRGSRLDLADLPDSEGDRSSLASRGSVSDRASALRTSAPCRRWTRTTLQPGEGHTRPSGGLRLTMTTCKFGRKCTRKDCWFDHPKGREIVDGDTDIVDSDEEVLGADTDKVSSMGVASLRLLVTAIIKESGKKSYLNVRNALQKPEYIGRPLTREEKHQIGEILEECEGSGSPERKSIERRPSSKSLAHCLPRSRGSRSLLNINDECAEGGRVSKGIVRNDSTRSLGRPSLKKRVSLKDLCKDPSLHSKLSAANTPGRRATSACP